MSSPTSESESRHAQARAVEWAVWGGIAFVVLAILGAFVRERMHAPTKPLMIISQVADFTLTNQLDRPVTLADLRGQVWVADIIFTRCPGPCATMTKRMSELQAALPTNAPVKLISLTTDPAHDTPRALATYGERFGADPKRWHFLTGPKADLVKLAVHSLKLTVLDKEEAKRTSPDDLFIHSTIFVVVDKQGRLRAVFESLDNVLTDEEVAAGASRENSSWEKGVKPRLLEAVNTLLLEPDK
ncbi:MAG: SCO family protein [Verrucomicrobia bacterium]|nr:SCO family protein [Verrucomicrobiota bacterium]